MSLTLAQFETLIGDEGVQIIDTRPSELWMDGHIPNSLHITPATVKYAVAMGLIEKETPIAFILPDTLGESVIAYFEKAGFTNNKGYLEGGYETWLNANKKIDLLNPETKKFTFFILEEMIKKYLRYHNFQKLMNDCPPN